MAPAGLNVGKEVPCVAGCRRGAKEAEAGLADFLGRKLETYAERRNDPNADATSEMSAHLHFGRISP